MLIKDRESTFPQQGHPLNSVNHQHRITRVPLELPTATIGRRQGLPSVQVHRIAYDTQGLLWAVGPSGLAMYDGSRVRTFTTLDGLSTHGLRSIAMGEQGRLWIVTDVGLDYRDPDGRIQVAFAGADWSHGSIEHIASDGLGGVWLATAVRLYHWSATTGVRAATMPDSEVGLIQALCVDAKGRLWLAGQDGLWSSPVASEDVSTRTWLAPRHSPWRAVGRIRGLLGTAQGLLIAGLHGAMVIADDGLMTTEFDDLPRQQVDAMLVSQDELWLASGAQLRHYQLMANFWCLKGIALEGARINDLCTDRFGNIWLATEDHAIIKVLGLRQGLTRPKLPATGAVCSIRPAPSVTDTFLIGGDHASYRAVLGPNPRADGFEAERLLALDGETTWDLLEDRQGQIWAATKTGLVMLDAGRRAHPGVAALAAHNPVLAGQGRAVLERKDGIWVGGVRGLSVVEHHEGQYQARMVTNSNGEAFGYVYTMLEASDGRLWVGTVGNGVWVETTDGFVRVESTHLTPTGNTYSLHQRGDGWMVVLQDDRIVLLKPDGTGRLLVTTDEPVSGWSARFVADVLWVGSSAGLREYDLETGNLRREITAWLGVEGWEFTTSQSLCTDTHNRLVCGLNTGLMLVNVPELNHLNTPPRARLGDLRWTDANATLHGDTLVMDAGNWTLEAELYTAWFLDETDVKFRHRLLGFAPTWSKPSSRPLLQYNSLPPGEYTLEIQAFSPLVGWGRVSRPGHLRVKASPLRQLLANTINLLSMPLLRSQRLRSQKLKLEQGIRERTLELEQARQELEVANKELHRLTRTDALTGLANRRHFDERLAMESQRSKRHLQPFSLLMVDVDFFKEFNDAYGHPEGDQCLTRIAAQLAQTIRGPSDLCARYGGEEFAVILPNTDLSEANAVAERIRQAVARCAFDHRRSPFGVVTVSIGVAEGRMADDQFSVMATADAALYAAKRAGRNTVMDLVDPSSKV